MAQVATVGEIEAHKTAPRRHKGLVNLQIGRATTQALNVDTPLLLVEVEGLESTLLAKQLDGVNVLVAAVVTRTGQALRVLVGHGRSQSIEDGTGCDILGGDEDDRLSLALDFLCLHRLLAIVCVYDFWPWQ